MMAGGGKTVFVANIPYDVSEEQLHGVFSEVGPVSGVEIKFDPQTGRSKGYAFVHYVDDATAASAVRNLHEVLVNGRNLRVESSNDEPTTNRRRKGPNDRPSGPGFGGGFRGDSPPRGGPPPGAGPGPGPGPGYGPGMGGNDGGRVDLSLLPPGQDLAPGQKATDAISATLAAVSPGQMQDVMTGMKTLVATQPDQARQLLQAKPQLAYALFQAMLLMNIVDPSVLQRIQPLPPTPAPAQSYPPANNPPYPPYGGQQPPAPAPNYPPYPPQGGYRPPADPRAGAPGGGYGGPPPPGPGYGAPPSSYAPPPAAGPPPLPPSTQAALAALPEDQRAMLVQVLQMTPDQINGLDQAQRDSIMQLKQQFLGSA